MNKENNNKIVDITNNLLITDNPLNILSNVYYKPRIVESKIEKQEKREREDDYYMSLLVKSKKKSASKTRKQDVFNLLQVFSKTERRFKTKKYFKFPFSYDIENDGSYLYFQIHAELVKALSYAYSNYRRFREGFRVKTGEGMVEFGKSVRASTKFEKLFSRNDITFRIEGGCLEVDVEDVSLVYDLLINMEVPRGCCMPFIISEYEFENAISYHTRIEEGPVIMVGKDKEYSYFIHGPLYSGNYITTDDMEVIYK